MPYEGCTAIVGLHACAPTLGKGFACADALALNLFRFRACDVRMPPHPPRFYLRSEMLCVGLHGAPMSGIVYATAAEVAAATGGALRRAVALAAVVSGGYEGDYDDGDTVVYTGVARGRRFGVRRGAVVAVTAPLGCLMVLPVTQ